MPTPSRAESAQNQSSGTVSPAIAAQSYRSAMRGETRVFLGTQTSKCFNVPAEWKNRYVNFYADGAIVYYHVSTGLDAAVDETAVSVETVGAGMRITLTANAQNLECHPIPSGAERPVWFPQDAQTFAIKCSASCKVRAHLSET